MTHYFCPHVPFPNSACPPVRRCRCLVRVRRHQLHCKCAKQPGGMPLCRTRPFLPRIPHVSLRVVAADHHFKHCELAREGAHMRSRLLCRIRHKGSVVRGLPDGACWLCLGLRLRVVHDWLPLFVVQPVPVGVSTIMIDPTVLYMDFVFNSTFDQECWPTKNYPFPQELVLPLASPLACQSV